MRSSRSEPNLSPGEQHALIALAARAREVAYAPYSGYRVGAAVVAGDDRVFHACNVENASLGLSLCAERSAIASAVAAGARSIRACVVVTTDGAWPCGACLQWLNEFGSPSLLLIGVAVDGRVRQTRLSNLLPEPFAL